MYSSVTHGDANTTQKHILNTLTAPPYYAFRDKGSWVLYVLKKVQYIWGQNDAAFFSFSMRNLEKHGYRLPNRKRSQSSA